MAKIQNRPLNIPPAQTAQLRLMWYEEILKRQCPDTDKKTALDGLIQIGSPQAIDIIISAASLKMDIHCRAEIFQVMAKNPALFLAPALHKADTSTGPDKARYLIALSAFNDNRGLARQRQHLEQDRFSDEELKEIIEIRLDLSQQGELAAVFNNKKEKLKDLLLEVANNSCPDIAAFAAACIIGQNLERSDNVSDNLTPDRRTELLPELSKIETDEANALLFSIIARHNPDEDILGGIITEKISTPGRFSLPGIFKNSQLFLHTQLLDLTKSEEFRREAWEIIFCGEEADIPATDKYKHKKLISDALPAIFKLDKDDSKKILQRLVSHYDISPNDLGIIVKALLRKDKPDELLNEVFRGKSQLLVKELKKLMGANSEPDLAALAAAVAPKVKHGQQTQSMDDLLREQKSREAEIELTKHMDPNTHYVELRQKLSANVIELQKAAVYAFRETTDDTTLNAIAMVLVLQLKEDADKFKEFLEIFKEAGNPYALKYLFAVCYNDLSKDLRAMFLTLLPKESLKPSLKDAVKDAIKNEVRYFAEAIKSANAVDLYNFIVRISFNSLKVEDKFALIEKAPEGISDKAREKIDQYLFNGTSSAQKFIQDSDIMELRRLIKATIPEFKASLLAAISDYSQSVAKNVLAGDNKYILRTETVPGLLRADYHNNLNGRLVLNTKKLEAVGRLLNETEVIEAVYHDDHIFDRAGKLFTDTGNEEIKKFRGALFYYRNRY